MDAKKSIAFLIVAAGLGTAVFVAKNDSRNGVPSISTFLGKEIKPGLQFESAKTQSVTIGGASGINNPQRTGNLTEAVVQNYFGEFVKNDLNAPDVNFTEEKIQEQIVNGLTFDEFGLEDFRVSKDDSIKAQVAYMKSIDALLNKNFPGFKQNITDILEEFMQEGNSSSLDYLVAHIPGYIDGLLALETPPLWKVYHLQLLNLWQKKLVAYRAILSVEEDPLKSYIAVQEIPNIINEDVTLQAILIERYQELNT